MTFDPVAFLEQAIRTPSDESVAEMRQLVLEELRARGVEPRVDDHGNTIATKGDGQPHLVLNTHLDTVAPHVEFEAEDGVFRGRGACDAKGPLAALLAAFLATDLREGRLTLALTPDEETTLQGSAALDLDGDAYVVGEPTDLDPCIAARGWVKATVTVDGRSAHASEPENGINAIREAATVVATLDDFDSQFEYDTDRLPGPNLTSTMIDGGEAENQVPASCTVVLDRRTVPPETPTSFARNLQEYLDERVQTEAAVTVELAGDETNFLSAFETDPESSIVEFLESRTGNAPRDFEAATEASRFTPAPVVVFGPGVLADDGSGVAHSDREYVETADVREAAEILTDIADAYLGGVGVSRR